MRTTCLGLLILLFCGSCKERHDHGGRTPLVELDGNFLYHEDLQLVLPADLSKDDSLLFAEHYIRNWAEDVLLYEKAQSNIPNSDEIDKLVENYRKALIMHTYQQELINQTLSEEISEAELTGYYEKHQELFKVERPLMKGLFIKVPLTAPQLGSVRRWYEYFYDKWVPITEVMDLMPLKVPDAGEYLNKNRHVELKDTAFHYFLNVSDYRAVGEQEPYEFARTQVKDMMLNMKQVEFMKQVKEDLYRRAEKRDKIKYY